MEPRDQAIKIFDRLKPLWIALTGGAFASFAGGALTLMYFWRIGGVPVGQAANLPALAKIVVATALVLSGTLLALWLFPALLSRAFLDKEPFAQLMHRLFTRPSRRPSGADAPSAPGAVAVASDAALPSTRCTTQIAGSRILSFALVTVGSGCVGLILAASGLLLEPSGKWTPWTWIGCVGIPFSVTGLGLLGLWRLFNKRADRVYGVVIENGRSLRGDSALMSWIVLGYSATLVSLYPVVLLMLVFLKTEFLLLHESMATFLLGAFAIAGSLVMTFSFSLFVLVNVERKIRSITRWALVVGVNVLILGAVSTLLGLGGRMLEGVMIMSSLRVERAVLMLEPEGCEILASMQAFGWGRAPGAAGKTCFLYDVTIQSSLEPAMQIACWRGVVDQREIAPPNEAATSAPNASVSPASEVASAALPAAANAASAASAPASAAKPMQYFHSGTRGSFSIPVKLIRSIRKTTGAEGIADAVCPSDYPLPLGAPIDSSPSGPSASEEERS